jgi:hypothetical protein
MNHTTLAITVGMLAAITAALIGAVGISIQSAAAIASKDPSSILDFENSETNFKFKQKLKNNCSGFSTCANTATETLATPPT